MAMKTGICKLCLQEKQLLNKSHIIPDFMYRDGKIYHDDHTVHKIDFGKSLKGKVARRGRQNSGEYEGGILCKECDGGIIKNYEDYTKLFLYGKQLSNQLMYQFSPGQVTVQNVDYAKIKLFFLSILWRASVSSRPFFKEIKIDENVREELREMILNGNPKGNEDFTMLFMLDAGDNPNLKQYIGQPVGSDNGRSFLFTYPGLIVYYVFDIDIVPKQILNFRLNDKGEIRFMKLSGNQIWDLFKYLFG